MILAYLLTLTEAQFHMHLMLWTMLSKVSSDFTDERLELWAIK